MDNSPTLNDIHLLKVKLRTVEQSLGTKFLGVRRQINKQLAKQQAGSARELTAGGLKDWVAEQSQSLWEKAKDWARQAYENDKRSLENRLNIAKKAAKAAVEEANIAMQKASEAMVDTVNQAWDTSQKYAYEKTKDGYMWVVDGGKKAKAKTKRQACRISNRACASMSAKKVEKRLKAVRIYKARMLRERATMRREIRRLESELEEAQKISAECTCKGKGKGKTKKTTSKNNSKGILV
jgi:hypothetical protein